MFNSKLPFEVLRQYFLPQHALSRFAGWLSHNKTPWLKDRLISHLLNKVPVNLQEALESDPKKYNCYHDFFTRKLKPGIRPIDQQLDSVTAPCDGTVFDLGAFSPQKILRAKNHEFNLQSLVGGEIENYRSFENGNFITIYLAPEDYHRVHMPLTGNLKLMRYVPGRLFSVNPKTCEHVPGLFAKNERVVCYFSHNQKPFIMILVGAMLVGSICTTWAGKVMPQSTKLPVTTLYPDNENQRISLSKGSDMGYFAFGSTVILLFPENDMQFGSLQAGDKVKLGEVIGNLQE